MATEVTCIVDTDGTQSPDYTSLSAAITGETGATPAVVTSADLVTNDEQLTIECRASAGGADSAATVDGFTTDSTRYVKVHTHANHRHSGTWNTGKYRIANSARHGYGIVVSDNYTRISGLQIELTSAEAAGSERGIAISNTGCRVSGNIIRRTGTMSGVGVSFDDVPSGDSFYAWNNLIIGFPQSFNYNHRYTTDTLSGCLYNNTCIDATIYVRFNTGNGSGFSIKNNIVQYASTNYMLANIGSTSNNISSDTSSPDSSYREIALDFNNSAGGDYSLASTDTDAIDDGADLHSDAILAFSDDIIGTSRPNGSWDIGAFEYVSGAAEATYSGRGIGRGISRGIMR